MDNKLPKKYKESIFSKVLNKIREIFYKKNAIIKENDNDTINKINSTTENKNNFVEQLNSNIELKDIDNEKKELMDRLRNNPELLQEFSVERLKKILEYYEIENERKRQLIKKLST